MPTKSPPTTTPPSSRSSALDETAFIAACVSTGNRLFRAGPGWIFALGPSSRRRPGSTAYEVSPSEGAHWLFHEFLWKGHPILEPYVSLERPDRLGFRYTHPEGKEYRSESRRLRRQAGLR